MKKRIIAFVMAACMVAGVAGCGKDKKEELDYTALTEKQFESLYKEAVKGLEDYVTLGEYKGVAYTPQEESTVTDEEVQEEIENLRETYATTTQVTDRAAASGDTVNIDYTGKIDGEEFDGGSSSAYDLTLGSGTFIPGFEDQLVGVTPGATVDVNVTFPEEYSNNPDLAGKAAVFTVTMNYIQGEKQLPELNDEFAAGLGLTDVTTVDGLKEYAKTAILSQKDQAKETTISNELIEKIAAETTLKDDFEKLIKDRIKKEKEVVASSEYKESFQQYLEDNSMTEDEYFEQYESDCRESEKTIRTFMLIAQKEGKEVTLDEFNEEVSYYTSYGYTADDIADIASDLLNSLIAQKGLEYCRENAVADASAAATDDSTATE